MDEDSLQSLSRTRTKVLGYLLSLCGSIGAAVGITTGQLIGDRIPAFQTNFYRFILQTIISGIFILVTRKNPKLPLKVRPAIVTMSAVIFNFGAGILFNVSSWYLPVTLVQGLLESVFLTLCGVLAIFRKKCSLDLPVATILCFSGCLLLIQPEGAFDNEDSGDNSTTPRYNFTLVFTNQTIESDHAHGVMGTVYGVLAASGIALCFWIHNQFLLKQLTEWTSVISVLFWIGLGCSVLSVPVLGILKQTFVIPSGGDIALGLVFGIAFTINSFCIMYAATLLPLSHVAVVLPSGLVFLFIFQKTILKHIQPGPDNWLVILGLILTLCGTILTPACDIIREKMASISMKETDPLCKELCN